MKRLNALASLVLASVLASPCSAEEKSGWEALGLESVKLDRATLYYEKCLEPKLGVFEARHKELVTEQAQQAKLTEELLEKFDEIVADVNQIVGASFKDDEKAKLEGALRSLLHQGMAFSRAIVKADACLAVRQTVKDYLRGGGSLPGFTYDKATDTAQYNWRQQFSLGKRTGVDKVLLPFPVSSPESMEEDLESRFSSYRKILPWLPGSFLHELVEMTIVVRLRPYNPYFRWFTDGFANAIASRLVRKHISEDAARLFASGHDVTEYSDLEKDINLYYWMGTDFCIETPLDSEERLKHARYAYATLEAERLIEKYGIECVAKIVDKACKDRVTNPRNLVAAVKGNFSGSGNWAAATCPRTIMPQLTCSFSWDMRSTQTGPYKTAWIFSRDGGSRKITPLYRSSLSNTRWGAAIPRRRWGRRRRF